MALSCPLPTYGDMDRDWDSQEEVGSPRNEVSFSRTSHGTSRTRSAAGEIAQQ